MCNYIYVGPTWGEPVLEGPAREYGDSRLTLQQKELSCQHHYHLVESWCPKYIETQKRCTPIIVSKQYWGDDICSACRERQQPSEHPWAKLIKRPSPNRFPAYPAYSYSPYPRQVSTLIV